MFFFRLWKDCPTNVKLWKYIELELLRCIILSCKIKLDRNFLNDSHSIKMWKTWKNSILTGWKMNFVVGKIPYCFEVTKNMLKQIFNELFSCRQQAGYILFSPNQTTQYRKVFFLFLNLIETSVLLSLDHLILNRDFPRTKLNFLSCFISVIYVQEFTDLAIRSTHVKS